MLRNHNHLHMNYLPFLGHKKWEAVHLVAAFLLTLIYNLMHTEEAGFTEVLLPTQAL